MDARDVPVNMRDDVEGAFGQVALDAVSNIAQVGGRFYRFRVRAQGRLGNTITQRHLCTIEGETCACVTGDQSLDSQ